jgi:hypothetical protein
MGLRTFKRSIEPLTECRLRLIQVGSTGFDRRLGGVIGGWGAGGDGADGKINCGGAGAGPANNRTNSKLPSVCNEATIECHGADCSESGSEGGWSGQLSG